MHGLQIDLLFAVLPCAQLPPHFRLLPLDVIEHTAAQVRDRVILVLPVGVDWSGCVCVCVCVCACVHACVCVYTPVCVHRRTSEGVKDPFVVIDRASAYGICAAAATSDFLRSSCDPHAFR